MIAAARRMLPWLSGLLSYVAWRLGRLRIASRPHEAGMAGRRVCVIQTNALGDVLMVTPLLQALIEAIGTEGVDVVLSKRAAPLLEHFPGLGSRLCVNGHLRWRSPSSVWEFIRVVRELRARRYRAILDTSRVVQSAWMTFLARPERGIGIRLPRRLGPATVEALGYLYTHEVQVDPDAHMIRQNLALLAPLAICPSSDRMRFFPSPADREAADAWLARAGLRPDSPFVVIHPGAKWPPKRWPADRFRLLANRLHGLGLAVVLVGDADDVSLLNAIAGGGTPPAIVLAGDLTLGGVGALIQRARLHIGNDSGLMHLASAVGTPVLALFGPTLPSRTAPLGPLDQAIMKPIPCRPCRLYFTHNTCERGHNFCMDLIEVDEVSSAAHALISQAAVGQPASS